MLNVLFLQQELIKSIKEMPNVLKPCLCGNFGKYELYNKDETMIVGNQASSNKDAPISQSILQI